MTRLILRLILQLALAYVLVAALVYVFQRHLQYFPGDEKPGSPAANGLPEMKSVQVRTADGLALEAWYAPPKHKDGTVVVVFHGNAGNLSNRAGKARLFLDRGYGVYLCEYRGFGGNPGSPTEQGLYADARAGIGFLEAQGYKPDRLAIYGESIGSGVAVEMALEVQPRFLILEAPFSSASYVAKQRYPFLPVDLLMKDRFDSDQKIGKIKAALLIMHGDADNVVPFASGYRLFEAATVTDKQFIRVPGGQHANLYEEFGVGPAVVKWLDREAGVLAEKAR